MICYRDRTYCDFYKKCSKGDKCGRALTEQVKKESKKIGLPVCLYGATPSCFRRKL